MNMLACKTKFAPWIALTTFLLLPAVARANDSPARAVAQQINAANELLRSGKTAEALSQYQDIASKDSVREELRYNQAVAHYRNGELDQAATLFLQSASSHDARIAASSKYNLGNCSFQRSLDLLEKEPNVAIAELQQAIAHYRGALRTDPKNSDARVNIELANKLSDQIKQQQQSKTDQPENQPDQNQNQQDKEQDKEQDTEQDSGQEQKQQQGDTKQDPGEQEPSEQDQNQDQQQQEQSDPNQPSKADDQNRQGNDPANDSGSEQQPSGADSPQEQESDSKQQQPTSPKDNQAPSPGESTQDPADSQKDETGENKPPKEADVDNDVDAKTPSGELTPATEEAEAAPAATANEKLDKAQYMSREEALKLLQSVRDRDMLRRMQRQQLERGRRVNVERDW